jgi:hypothetical protein
MSNQNIKFNNFYEFLNKKYLNMLKKIDKRKQSLRQLEQKGGAKDEIVKIQVELIMLHKLLEALKLNLQKGQTLNFDAIEKPIKDLNEKMKIFSEQLNKKLDPKFTEAEQIQIVNQIKDLGDFVNDYKDNYLDIKIKQTDKFVHPKIDLPNIIGNYKDLFTSVETDVRKLLTELKTLDSIKNEDDSEFKQKMRPLDEKMGFLNQKMQEIDSAISTINNYTGEINRYITEYNTFNIDLNNFQSPELFETEMIDVDALTGITIVDKEIGFNRVVENIDRVFTGLNIDKNQLIDPQLLEMQKKGILLQPRGPSVGIMVEEQKSQKGGEMKTLISDKEMSAILDNIYLKWKESFDKIRQKVLEQKEEEERQHKELERQQPIKTQEINTLVQQFKEYMGREFTVINNNISFIISQLKIANSNLTKSKKYNCEEKSSYIQTILKILGSAPQTISNMIIDINTSLDKIKLENEKPGVKSLEKFDSLQVQIQTKIKDFKEQIAIVEKNIRESNVLKDKYEEKCREKIDEEIKEMNSKFIQNKIDETTKYIKILKSDEYNKQIKKIEKNPGYINNLKYLNIKITEQNINQVYDGIKKMLGLISLHVDIKTKKEIEIFTNLDEKHRERISNKMFPQKGGFIDQWNVYYTKLIEIFTMLSDYKVKLNEFKKSAKQFNLLYMQLYNHQLFITNYIQLVLLNKKYKIYM